MNNTTTLIITTGSAHIVELGRLKEKYHGSHFTPCEVYDLKWSWSDFFKNYQHNEIAILFNTIINDDINRTYRKRG